MTHHLLIEAAGYRGRNGYAYYLLCRWLFHVIGAWTWLVIGAVAGLAAWVSVPTRSGPGRKRPPGSSWPPDGSRPGTRP